VDARLRLRREHLRTAGQLQELNHRFAIRAAQDRCLSHAEGRVVTDGKFATRRFDVNSLTLALGAGAANFGK
jgi:hypothetical protein